MSALGIAATVLYSLAGALTFVLVSRALARDDRRHRHTDPAWLNGLGAFAAAIFWPLLAVGVIFGWAFRLASRGA